jgi:glycosyltransferase involved in cell wall biosynthesis
VQRFPKGQMRLYRGVDRISTVSEAVAAGIVAERPELAGRIAVIPNPVDLAVFHPPADRRAGEPLRLLYTGRIHPEKGLHLLVAAWRALVDRGAAIELRLVGPSEVAAGGGGEAYLHRLRDAAGGRGFTLAGAIAEPTRLAEALRGADLYCYPSTADRGEALPVAPLEAMACGLAPVVMDLPQYRGRIEEGRTGLVVPRCADEVPALVAALSRLVADAPLRDRLGRAAAAVAAAQLGIDAVAEAYLEEFAASVPSTRV